MLKRGGLVREAINATERFSQGASMYHFSSDIGLSRARRQTPLRWTVGARADVSETGADDRRCERCRVPVHPQSHRSSQRQLIRYLALPLPPVRHAGMVGTDAMITARLVRDPPRALRPMPHCGW